MIDQRRLPADLVVARCDDAETVARAISELWVRGAPAIGIAAAYGLVLAANVSKAESVDDLRLELDAAAARLRATRPTAVNLGWALDELLGVLTAAMNVGHARDLLAARAAGLVVEDESACRRIGELGATLFGPSSTVLTHCNAGALATAAYGTALGIVRAVHEQGKLTRVLADETRPVLQGARLTAWELQQDGIPVTIIADGAAAYFMGRGEVDAVVVGADRIAANGDVANKIGTYGLAVIAHAHGIPFYVAAPVSTVDLFTASGGEIPIEERGADELTHVGGRRIAPEGVSVANPAFDVTPAHYVTAIVTDRGIARAPYGATLAALFERALVA